MTVHWSMLLLLLLLLGTATTTIFANEDREKAAADAAAAFERELEAELAEEEAAMIEDFASGELDDNLAVYVGA